VNLGNLRPNKGAIKKAKRVGRGPGSGHGKTSTRGHKGQKARNTVHRWFEGGQMPLQRRVPKRGFFSHFDHDYQVVNVGDLVRCEAAAITPALLAAKGLVRSATRPVKILADGEVASALEVRAHAYSKKAKEKIEARGGKALWIDASGKDIEPPRPKRIYRPKPVVAEEEPATKEKGKEKGGKAQEKGKGGASAGAKGGAKPAAAKAAGDGGKGSKGKA
jgi:large subunit ribosomal protein L15